MSPIPLDNSRIQSTGRSEFDGKPSSDKYLHRVRLKQGRQIKYFNNIIIVIIKIHGNFYSATNYPWIGSLPALYKDIKT